jgi:broad specificity phosphatase PhoE
MIVAIVLACLLVPPVQSATQEPRPLTVFLVRHAERGTAPADDPALSDAGRERAESLARMLGNAGVTAIYTTQFARTKQTAEPLAKRLGLTPVPLAVQVEASNPRKMSEQSLREVVGKIRGHAGAVLVVGHSNTVPDIVRALGGDAPEIGEQDFDDFFVVTVCGEGKAAVARLKYGASR